MRCLIISPKRQIMCGRKSIFMILTALVISTNFPFPAHAQTIEKIIDWDKEVQDAGGLKNWAGQKVDDWLGKAKREIIDYAPYSENIKDARDIYNLRSRNESQAMDLVTRGTSNFDDIDPGTFDREADRVGLDYMKDGLSTAKEVIERKGEKLLEPLDEIAGSVQKQLGRVEHVGKRLGELKDAVGSRLEDLRDRFSSEHDDAIEQSGPGSGTDGRAGAEAKSYSTNAEEPIYSGPLTDEAESGGPIPQDISDGLTGGGGTTPNTGSLTEWTEVVPDRDLTGSGWVEIQPEQDFDPSLRGGAGSDPVAQFIHSLDTSAADQQVSEYLEGLNPALSEMQRRLQGDYDRIGQEMNGRLARIGETYGNASRQLNDMFSNAVQQEFGRATSRLSSEGMPDLNSRCQIVVTEMNRNQSFLRGNPEGLARDAAGNAYNVRERNQQLQSWYNQNCR